MNKNARFSCFALQKVILSVLLAFVSLTLAAQEKLIRIDSEDVAWQKKDPQFSFFNKEKARLLMPQYAAFGVECIPSFSPEWSLAYDSVAHTLVYNEAQKSIWYSTYDAMHKENTKTEKTSTWEIVTYQLRKKPKNYHAPDVKTYTLSINSEQVQMLKAIWSNAIGTSEPNEILMTDGTTWIYFIGEQRAKARTGDNYNNYSIVKLTEKLVEAIKSGDASHCGSLIGAEFQRVVANLEVVPSLND